MVPTRRLPGRHAGRQGPVRRQEVPGGGGQFATAADRWPDTPLEEDALFLEARASSFRTDPKAHDTYGGLLKKYTNMRHLDTVAARESPSAGTGSSCRTPSRWPTTPNLTDGGGPMFDTFGYAVRGVRAGRLNDPMGRLADAA